MSGEFVAAVNAVMAGPKIVVGNSAEEMMGPSSSLSEKANSSLVSPMIS